MRTTKTQKTVEGKVWDMWTVLTYTQVNCSARQEEGFCVCHMHRFKVERQFWCAGKSSVSSRCRFHVFIVGFRSWERRHGHNFNVDLSVSLWQMEPLEQIIHDFSCARLRDR